MQQIRYASDATTLALPYSIASKFPAIPSPSQPHAIVCCSYRCRWRSRLQTVQGHGVTESTSKDQMQRLSSLLNGATETFPTLQRLLQQLGWDGRQFSEGNPVVQTL